MLIYTQKLYKKIVYIYSIKSRLYLYISLMLHYYIGRGAKKIHEHDYLYRIIGLVGNYRKKFATLAQHFKRGIHVYFILPSYFLSVQSEGPWEEIINVS